MRERETETWASSVASHTPLAGNLTSTLLVYWMMLQRTEPHRSGEKPKPVERKKPRRNTASCPFSPQFNLETSCVLCFIVVLGEERKFRREFVAPGFNLHVLLSKEVSFEPLSVFLSQTPHCHFDHISPTPIKMREKEKKFRKKIKRKNTKRLERKKA